MGVMTVIWWRDIPAQVIAREGRRQSKQVLHPRFQVAIDKAAAGPARAPTTTTSRSGAASSAAAATTSRPRSPPRPSALETEYDKHRLAELIQSGGVEGGPSCAGPRDADPAQAETRRMTETVLSSATREVVIGFDRPFVIIGERINPTGRKLLAEEMKAGDFSRVERDVLAQVEAGAHMLDVNAGIPLADEPAILAQTIQLVQSLTDLPLSIDSSIVEALEAGLAVYLGKPLVNSVTGEEERLERVLPLVRKYGAAVVAISNDDTGHQRGPGRPLRGREADRRARRGPRDPAPRTSSSTRSSCRSARWPTAGRQVFALVGRLREELRVNTTCGASNVSFGLPNREGINAAFLPMAIAAGMTSAITNPMQPEVKRAVMAADVLMGNDPDCGRWIRRIRAAAPEGEVAAAGQPPARRRRPG